MKNKPHIVKNRQLRNPGNQESLAFRLAYALKLRKVLSIDITRQIDISKSTMSLYLHGKSMPSKERVIKLANCLRVDPAWLLGLTPLEAYNRFDENDPYLDEELEKLKNIFRHLNKQGREHLVNTAVLLFESDRYK